MIDQSPGLSPAGSKHTWRSLMTPARWAGVAHIVVTGLVIFLYWKGWLPRWALFVAVAFGLLPLVKEGVVDLVRERRIGTEIFVTAATAIAMAGGEYVAGAVLLVIILVAEFIAGFNLDRAQASSSRHWESLAAVPRSIP